MSFIIQDKTLALRLATAHDEPFLFRLYASTRATELAAWGWEEKLQEQFLQLQFRAQQQHYHAYPNLTHWIIEAQAPLNAAGKSASQQLVQPLGRVLLSSPSEELRLVDISLLPDWRGQGLGTALLEWIQTQSRHAHKPVRLHVAPDNPARRLYERLGFHICEDRASHLLMEWSSPSERNTSHHDG